MSEDIKNLTTFEQRIAFYLLVILILLIQGVRLLSSFYHPDYEVYQHIKRLNTAGEIAKIERMKPRPIAGYEVVFKAKMSQINANEVKQSANAIEQFFESTDGNTLLKKLFKSSKHKYITIRFYTQDSWFRSDGNLIYEIYVMIEPQDISQPRKE